MNKQNLEMDIRQCLNIARCIEGRTVGNIELGERLMEVIQKHLTPKKYFLVSQDVGIVDTATEENLEEFKDEMARQFEDNPCAELRIIKGEEIEWDTRTIVEFKE